MADDRNGISVDRLVVEHHEAVYRYAYRLSGSVSDAEDLTQQVFLVAQEKLGQLRNEECARSWLFTVLRNGFLRTRQRRRPTVETSLQLDIDSIPAEIPDEDDIDREQLQQGIDQLPEKFRVVLLMFYFEQCSYREIAGQLDLPIGTVMSRLARAKAHLRTRLFASDEASRETPSTAAAE